MAIDPPWRLDPYQNIVNVHWADKVDDIWIVWQMVGPELTTIYTQDEFSIFIMELQGAGGPSIVNYNVDMHYVPGGSFTSVFYPYQDLRQYRYNTLRDDASPDAGPKYLLPDVVSVTDLRRFFAASWYTKAILLTSGTDRTGLYGSRNQSFLINATQCGGGGNSGSVSLIGIYRHGGFFQGAPGAGPSWWQVDSYRLIDPEKPLGTALGPETKTFTGPPPGGGPQDFYIRHVTSNAHHISRLFNGVPFTGTVMNHGPFFATCDLGTGELS